MRVVVYTAVVGGYDVVLPPKFRDAGLDYVMLTDRAPLFRGGWTVRPLPPETAGMTPGEANRWCKFFAHRIFPEADATVYVDGNVRQTASFLPCLREMEEAGAEIGLFAHPRRGTVAEEHARCVEIGKIGPEELARYEARLRAYAKDLPGEAPLRENSVILRRGASPRLEAAMEAWWREFRRGIRRDQISLPWVLATARLEAKIWDRNFRFTDPPLVQVANHRRSRGAMHDAYFVLRQMHEEMPFGAPLLACAEGVRALRRGVLSMLNGSRGGGGAPLSPARRLR